MEEAGDAALVAEVPGEGDEALVGVRLDALEVGVALERREHGLGAGGLLVLGEVGGAGGGVGEGGVASVGDLARGELLEDEAGVAVAEHAGFGPGDGDPGRVPQDEVEAAALNELVGELELPVVEAVASGQLAHEPEARVGGDDLLEVDEAGGGEQGAALVARLGGGEELGLAELRARRHLGVEDQRELLEVLVAVGQLVGEVEGPEPEGVPVVHDQLQAAVGARGAHALRLQLAGPDAVLVLGGGGGAAAQGVGEAVQIEGVGGAQPHLAELLGVGAPEAVDGVGEAHQGVALVAGEGRAEVAAPAGDGGEGVGAQGLDGFALGALGVGGHAAVAEEEVIHAALGARGAGGEGHAGGDGVEPGGARGALLVAAGAGHLGAGAVGVGVQLGGGEDLVPGAHEGVAAAELGAEPGHEEAAIGGGRGGVGGVGGVGAGAEDGVEPEGDLGELEGDGVLVDAEDVVVGDVHLHSLELVAVARLGDALAQLLLALGEVALGELVDGLVEEGCAAHGGLADGQGQELGGGAARAAVLVVEELAEGVLDEAAGEDLGGVVAGGLLAVASGLAVDEGARGVGADAVSVEDPLGLAVVAELGLGDEEGDAELVVVVVAGGFDLVEGLFGEEAAEGEQRLVGGAELVDAEGGVGDAADAVAALARALLGAREAHLAQDGEQDAVAQADLGEERGALGVEEVGAQGVEVEGVVEALLARAVGALVDHAEEAAQAVVDVEALARLFGLEVVEAVELAQALQGVALAVGVGAHGGVAELGAGLDVEEEEQAVHEAQALEGELLGVDLLAEDALARDLAAVADGLVADGFDGGAQGVLQVFADGVGVLVGAVVEGVDEGRSGGGGQGVAVEEGDHRLQGARLAAAEELVEVEAQEALLGPLAAVGQDELAFAQDEHEARRLLEGEGGGDEVFDGGAGRGQRAGQARGAEGHEGLAQAGHLAGHRGKGRQQGLLQEVGVGVELGGGGHEPHQGRGVGAGHGGVEGERRVCGARAEGHGGGALLVAQGVEGAGPPVAVEGHAGGGGAGLAQALAVGEVVAVEAAQGAPGRDGRGVGLGVGGVVGVVEGGVVGVGGGVVGVGGGVVGGRGRGGGGGGGGAPAGQGGGKVGREHGGQVVLGVELVDVLDADEGAAHGAGSAGAPTRTPTTWRKGARSGVRASRTHSA